MTRRLPLRAPLVAVFLIAGVLGSSSAGADAPRLEQSRRAFLRDRDAGRLAAALSGLPAKTADEATDSALAALAAGASTAPPAVGARGYQALPEILGYFRRLDLTRAEASTARLGRASLPAGVDVWIRALVDVRRGRDESARRRLLAWRVGSEPSERAAFRIALLGAVLPEEDRVLLAGVGRHALLEAAGERHFETVAVLAECLVSLDASAGAEALCLALRALRRGGQAGEADVLLTRPAAAAVGAHPCFRLERAVHAAWRGRKERLAAALDGLDVPPALREIVVRLGLTRGFTMSPPGAEVEVPFEERHAHALAALATLLGRPTPASEVDAAALAQGVHPADGAFLKRFLADRGFAVLSVAGGGETALRAADAGIPFLLRAIHLEGESFREEPVLVLGRDAASKLWLTCPADVERLDVLVGEAPAKARLLLALPKARATELATWPMGGEREAGQLLDRAVAMASAGRLDAAIRLVSATNRGSSTPPAVLALYEAWFEHRQHLRRLEDGNTEGAAEDLLAVRDALRRSMAVPPPLVFEYLALYQSLYATGRRDAAVESLEAAETAAPGSSYVPLTLFAVYQREGRRRDALGALDRAHRAAPLDTSMLYYRGRALRVLGRVEAARGDLVRALDRRPDWVPVGIELARLELNQRRPRAALRVLDDLQKRVPSLGLDDTAAVLRREAEHRLVQAARTVEETLPLLGSTDRETRRRATYRLADFETDQSEARLRVLLDDSDPAVRVTVLRAYMRPWLRTRAQKDAALAGRLLGVLRDDESPQARGAAVGLLSLIRRPGLIEVLAGALAGPGADASPSVRCEIASVLARHDSPRVRAALVEALTDSDRHVRMAAIDALLQIAGTYRGFDPEGTPEERARAVAAWRAWLSS